MPGSELFGVGDGAVGDRHGAYTLFAQIVGDPLNGVAGPEQQRCLRGEVGEDPPGHGNGGVGHGYGVAPDVGIGADAFRRIERHPRQKVQVRAQCAEIARQLAGGLDLAHDLRLAEHLGVEAGGHTNQVAGGILVPVTVSGALDFIGGYGPIVGEPLRQGRFVGRVDDAIDFGAVAGREDGRFRHARDRTGNGHQGAAQRVARKRNTVPQVQCGGAVVDAVCQYRHFERGPSVVGVTVNCSRGQMGPCPGPGGMRRLPEPPREVRQGYRWPAVLLALLVVAGCAQIPVESGPVDFQVKGKVGVVEGERSYAARFVWRQTGDRYDIVLWGPLGQGSTRLRGGPDRIEVTGGKDGPSLSGDPGQVMRQRLGWSLPLEVLPWWISGRPAPDGPVESSRRDGEGRLTAFRQLGWQVNYDRFDAGEDPAGPGRITAERPGYRIRVTISSR